MFEPSCLAPVWKQMCRARVAIAVSAVFSPEDAAVYSPCLKMRRVVCRYETILSGDLLGNDGPGAFENNDENS